MDMSESRQSEYADDERRALGSALRRALRIITIQEQEILRLKRKCGETEMISFLEEK